MKRLSIAIAAYNEEAHIGRCLASVARWVDEIVLVDGGSKDKTVAIAKTFGAKVIETTNPPIFHINKQKALDSSRGEWILQLDADEVVSPELQEEILSVTKGDLGVNGFYVPRKNFFCGRWLRKGGQYPDYVIRLIRRGHALFPAKSVHEQIAVDGSVGYLQNPLLHFSYDSVGEYWCKANSYIDLQAQELKIQNLAVTPVTWFIYNAVKPTVTFFLIFFRHKGFMDGYWGFLFALFSALHYPFAYMRYVKSTR